MKFCNPGGRTRTRDQSLRNECSIHLSYAGMLDRVPPSEYRGFYCEPPEGLHANSPTLWVCQVHNPHSGLHDARSIDLFGRPATLAKQPLNGLVKVLGDWRPSRMPVDDPN
jgi:hypothetical protein